MTVVRRFLLVQTHVQVRCVLLQIGEFVGPGVIGRRNVLLGRVSASGERVAVIRLETIAPPVAGKLVRRHINGMRGRDTRCQLIERQQRHFRHGTFLVDHLEQVLAQLGKLFGSYRLIE